MSNHHTITVLIADDHEMTRKGIRAFLEQSPDIDVVGEAGDGDQLKELVAHLHPQILLLDLIMPNLSPAELEKWVRTNHPVYTAPCWAKVFDRAGMADRRSPPCRAAICMEGCRTVAGVGIDEDAQLSGVGWE